MIYLIRHAQSIGNVNGRAASHASIALTKHGHAQATQLTTQLPRASRIFVSPFIRTAQTAAPILKRDVIIAETHAIQEFSYLSEQRCSHTTLEERKPFVDAYWQRADVDYYDAEDAESFAMFYERVNQFIQQLDQIKDRYQDQHLLVFSHGQFLTLFKLIVAKQYPLSSALMKQFRHNMIEQPLKNTEFFIYA